MARTRLDQLLGPSDLERLVAAAERQATALERLIQLGEVALGLDPPTLEAAAAAAAAAAARTPADAEAVDISNGPDQAAIRKIEEITLALGVAMGRMPTDDEIHEELNRQEQVEATAAAYAAGLGGILGERGGSLLG